MPENVVEELKEELKRAKANERQYCRQEVIKLKAEQEKYKEKLDHLFDLRPDGELDRESFDLKRDELRLKMERLKCRIIAHEKADDSFNNAILELLDIATEAGYLFARSTNIELKRFLLRFVFKSLKLTEGKLTYELNFPFSEFETPKPKRKLPTALELVEGKENIGSQGIYSKKVGNDNTAALELQKALKKQGVRPQNLTPVYFGWRRRAEPELIF